VTVPWSPWSSLANGGKPKNSKPTLSSPGVRSKGQGRKTAGASYPGCGVRPSDQFSPVGRLGATRTSSRTSPVDSMRASGKPWEHPKHPFFFRLGFGHRESAGGACGFNGRATATASRCRSRRLLRRRPRRPRAACDIYSWTGTGHAPSTKKRPRKTPSRRDDGGSGGQTLLLYGNGSRGGRLGRPTDISGPSAGRGAPHIPYRLAGFPSRATGSAQ